MNLSSPVEEVNRDLPAWLTSTLLRRSDLAPRFVYWRQRLARQSRGWRRRLRRQLAVGVTGAALLLAVAGVGAQLGPTATDNAITVVNGQVAITANGQCSLMEAIQNANNKTNGRPYNDCAAGNPNGADTINLPANGLFTLNSAFLPDASVGPIGLPWISTAVTINGNGATIQRGSNAPDFRIMAIGYQGNLTLNNTTIRSGNLTSEGCSDDFYNVPTSGAGILNQGQLSISGSTITENHIECSGLASGGGIFSSGMLSVSNSTIRDNTVYGVYSAYGGGIYNSGTLTIIASNADANFADADNRSAGGGIYSNGTLTISGSTIRDNAAYGISGGYGGGIRSHGSLSISNSTLSGNKSFGNHGGAGGGIDSRGQLTILNSTVDNNQASGYDGSTSGVGVTASGTSYISGSTFVANSILLIGDNLPEITPAIGNYGIMVIANSTVSSNDVLGVGNYGDLTIANSTITDNVSGVRAVCGWGSEEDITRLQRTIVSGNAGSEVVLDNQDQNGCPAISVDSHNLFGKNGNAGVSGFTPGPTDIVPAVGVSAILSPLADNGGPTQTHALPAGSPALDRAPNASCTAVPVNGLDQRGQPRNQNGSGSTSANECDVGAFERGGSAPPPVGAFYLSPAKAGTIGGVAFAPADILKFDPATGWTLYFDGSDVGITKNVTAFELQADGSILLSLVAAQTVPGAGNVAPQDILRFTPTATGPNTSGTFQLWVDGSNVGLTTAEEKIDALGLAADGRIAISTTGAATVAGPGGTTIRTADEDALGFNRANATWSTLLDLTAIPGMGPEDVNALWINPTTGEVFVSLVSAFNLSGVTGDAKDIVKLTPNGSGYTPSLYWDGSAAGFPAIIDGLEMIN